MRDSQGGSVNFSVSLYSLIYVSAATHTSCSKQRHGFIKMPVKVDCTQAKNLFLDSVSTEIIPIKMFRCLNMIFMYFNPTRFFRTLFLFLTL